VVFRALVRRDLHVVSRELPMFLLRTTLQPIMFTFVFGYLLPRMGFVQSGYAGALLPGILGVSLAFASVQAVALPMVADFGWTLEIEDRLLAPVPTWVIAAEKVIAGTVQGVIAALFVLPVARLIMGPIPGLGFAHLGVVAGMTLLGAFTFSAFGLVLGTAIRGEQIGLMFGLIVAPMIFFGCAYYPWKALAATPVVQVLVLVNPLVYVSEGMRSALTPSLPHMSPVVVAGALVLASMASPAPKKYARTWSRTRPRTRLVIVAIPMTPAERTRRDDAGLVLRFKTYGCSFRRTSSLTTFPSTVLPARSAITAFITFPISFADVAPVDAIALSTAFSRSAAPTAAGR
jgi:ABC-2 type transport system permease protein